MQDPECQLVFISGVMVDWLASMFGRPILRLRQLWSPVRATYARGLSDCVFAAISPLTTATRIGIETSSLNGSQIPFSAIDRANGTASSPATCRAKDLGGGTPAQQSEFHP